MVTSEWIDDGAVYVSLPAAEPAGGLDSGAPATAPAPLPGRTRSPRRAAGA